MKCCLEYFDLVHKVVINLALKPVRGDKLCVHVITQELLPYHSEWHVFFMELWQRSSLVHANCANIVMGHVQRKLIIHHVPHRPEFMPHPSLAAQIDLLSKQNSTLPMAHNTTFCENCDQPPLGHALTDSQCV